MTAMRHRVELRAQGRCEYCRISQDADSFYRFHIEHVLPRKHGGETAFTNLALACHHCNLHKGSDLTGIDPETSRVTRLYNPRRQRWENHFRLRAGRIVGRTAVGRTTVHVLRMNAVERVELRTIA